MPQPEYAARLIVDDYEVDRFLLTEIGLPRGVFQLAAQRGLREQGMTTSDDAEGAAGYYLWTRTLRTLRQEARTHDEGWHRDALRNIPVVFNPLGTVAVAVSAGNERVGIGGPDPITRQAKGPGTEAAVEGNRPHLPGTEEGAGVDFYYFLVWSDPDALTIRGEVSQPTAIDHAGNISQWSVRAILGDLSDNGPDPVRRSVPTSSPVAPAGDAIVVPVTRKSA